MKVIRIKGLRFKHNAINPHWCCWYASCSFSRTARLKRGVDKAGRGGHNGGRELAGSKDFAKVLRRYFRQMTNAMRAGLQLVARNLAEQGRRFAL